MKVLRDRHTVFDIGHQQERRFSSGIKVGRPPILFIGDNQEERGLKSGVKRLLNLQENNLWFLTGQALLIAAVIIGWRIVSEPGSGATLLQTPGVTKTGQSDAASRRVIEAQEQQVAGLNEHVSMLTDSIKSRKPDPVVKTNRGLASSIARKQTASAEPEQILETTPPTAAVQKAGNVNLAQPSNPLTNSAAATQSGAGNVVPTVSGTAAFRAGHAPVGNKRPPGSVGTGGPWVINLASSTRKTDADRFEEKARSMEIKTEQQLVTIKGHQYWRVQITGFASAKEARTRVDEVQEKLGLKDVWILKRQ
jgi:hypothetical protein